jgi:hypothetical protein
VEPAQPESSSKLEKLRSRRRNPEGWTAMQRRTAQAAGWSVVLHAALVVAVLLIRPHVGEGPSRTSIIEAELVFDAGAWSSSRDADTEKEGAAAARATPVPEAPEPAETDEPDEPATNAAIAEVNPPAPAEQAADATAEPAGPLREPEAAASSADAASAPTETVAAEESPPVDAAADSQPATSDAA